MLRYGLLTRSALRKAEASRITRYADDLFFSTHHPNILRQVAQNVNALIAELKLPGHLTVNTDKTRHSSKRGTRRVTGIVLGSDGKAHIGRRLTRKIRSLIYGLDKLDPRARAFLAGMLAYPSGFDPDFMNSLITKYGYSQISSARGPNV